MNSSLEYYKVFYHVGELSSITMAAERLCISQPAASQAIRQLEAALDTRLFVRLPKGVALTQEGELLYHYVKKGLDAIWYGETMLRRMQDLETGEVRIGASDMTLQFYLLPYLEAFHKLYPKVRVTVSNGPTPETLANLNQGMIDFGVVSTPFESGTDLESVNVKEIRSIFVAGAQFAAFRGRELDYEELTGVPCIFLEKNTSTRKGMDDFLRERGLVLVPEFELATSDMIVQFAMRNLGVGCVMEGFAENALTDGKLFELTFQEPMPLRHFCIVSNAHNPVSPAGKRLLQLMTEDCSI